MSLRYVRDEQPRRLPLFRFRSFINPVLASTWSDEVYCFIAPSLRCDICFVEFLSCSSHAMPLTPWLLVH